jgi:hypothetical protein
MKKYIPIAKRSKKEQKAENASKRGSWNGINPVTRKPVNPKAYDRKRAWEWSDDDSTTVPYIYTSLFLATCSGHFCCIESMFL